MKTPRLFHHWFAAPFALVVLFMLYGSCGPVNAKGGGESSALQQARTIAMAMFQYAHDHGEKYPAGSSSTELFQKLIDGNYVDNSETFYVPMTGKVKAKLGERLKPENVSFDATGGTDLNSPKSLPIVFLTGYKVDYRAGGGAVSLIAPAPPYEMSRRTWLDWWRGVPSRVFGPFLVVAYMNNYAYIKTVEVPPGGHGFVHDFVPADFDAKGKTYRQLTPDGVMK
jgi:hypothetical protein